MNIWKKPAPSINTHSSGYSRGPQGPGLFLYQRALRAVTHCTCVGNWEFLPPSTCQSQPQHRLSQHLRLFTLLTFAALISTHTHAYTPCEQGGRPALLTPDSKFPHTDQQGEIPTSHTTFPRQLPSFWDWQKVAGCYSSEMPDLIHIEHQELKCLTSDPQAWYLKPRDLYLSLLFPKVFFRI